MLHAPAASADADVLLPAEQAFKLSAKWLTAERIRIRWDIADGYYMYRDKISFAISGQLGESRTISIPELPAGITKQDALFGEVQVFTKNFTSDISITAANTSFDLIVSGQGCNEPVGVCYPPMRREIHFLDVGKETQSDPEAQQSTMPLWPDVIDSGRVDRVESLRLLLAGGFQQPDFLNVDDAFKLHIATVQKNKISAIFVIADGYYLYRDRIKFSNDGENRIQQVVLPAGKIKQDKYFGKVAIFDSELSPSIELSINELGNHNAGADGMDNLIINASYQGCAEDGICYSPVNKSFDIAALPVITQTQVSHQTTAKSTGDTDTDAVAAQTPWSLWSFLLGAFFAGLLLTFTPCVLPMIPILSSVIIGQGSHLTKTRGGILATAYVLGSTVTYAGMGALAGATGDQLQAYFQNIWAIGLLSALFFIMALSMFGLFEIRMPAFIQSSVQAKTNNLRGSIPLVFLLGLVSALIIGACVSPILITFLGVAISRGDPLLGAQLMSAMAVGMGIPLIAFGLGIGHVIPRSGRWMEQVKRGFGLLLIAVAIYLLGSIPQVPTLLLWGSFFIVLGVFMNTTSATPEPASNWRRLGKGLGIILLVWGIFLLAGGFLGQRDLFRPLPLNLSALSPPAIFAERKDVAGLVEPDATHHFIQVTNNAELEQQLARARAQNKPLLMDYYATWCVDCIRMEETTFSDSRIKTVLAEKFITVQIDVTDPQDADNRALKRRFDVFGPPATLFIDRNGRLLTQMSFYGYMDSTKFLSLLNAVDN